MPAPKGPQKGPNKNKATIATPPDSGTMTSYPDLMAGMLQLGVYSEESGLLGPPSPTKYPPENPYLLPLPQNPPVVFSLELLKVLGRIEVSIGRLNKKNNL